MDSLEISHMLLTLLLAKAFLYSAVLGEEPRMPGILGHLGKCSMSYIPAATCNILAKAPSAPSTKNKQTQRGLVTLPRTDSYVIAAKARI